MFYTNKSIRLHTRCLAYLDLIQQANKRYQSKIEYLAEYNSAKSDFDIIRLMTTRGYIISQIERWENLSTWLLLRYQVVRAELCKENERQLKKEIERLKTLSINKENTIDL